MEIYIGCRILEHDFLKKSYHIMKESLNKEREKYKLIYQRGVELITDYLPGYLSEAENLTYFEKQDEYPVDQESEFRIEFKLDTSDRINYQLTALSILREGGKLSILLWQDFENFIAEWLLFQGWCVTKKAIPQNGGINITTTKYIENIGLVKCIWITKKYGPHRFVGLKIVRELAYLISKSGASKGIVVTTSRLTKGAVDFINKNQFTMSYIDNEMLEKRI